MSKSRVCAENSNLVTLTCNKKTNLLVYEREKGDTCKQPKAYIPPISSPQMKRIKVCTGQELKRICPSPPCPCPPKVPVPGMVFRFGQFLKFGAKTAVALGAVFLTYDMGIWGDSETTGRIYKGVCAFLLPKIITPPEDIPVSPSCQEEQTMFGRRDFDKFCCDKFPVDSEPGMYRAQQKWNKIVTCTFGAMTEIPAEMSRISKKLYCKFVNSDSCKEAAKEEECGPCDC